jgi:glyoxylase-like metal-dependent hydrolase (beta-lactamase superfamily II)
MNPLESQLDYKFGNTVPEPGQAQEIAPGLWWLRMRLPFALDHINLWLLEDIFDADSDQRQGWTVIDCGIASDATRASWETVFSNHLRDMPLGRVIATHCHPDHVGLADWLCGRWQAPLWMTTGEYAFARMMSSSLPGVDGTSALPHYQRHGLVDPDALEQLRGRKSYYRNLVPAVPDAYHRINDGQNLRIGQRQWRVITGYGHAPEHATLYCDEAKILISGDMVLPRISTNVSVFAIEPEGNPLQLYLDSLCNYETLPVDTLVLPSHGKPFYGLHTRIAQLRQHHAERLAEVMLACQRPQSAATIVPIMFARVLDSHQLTFAFGEALAHLHKLWYEGKLSREVGADGVIRFRVADADVQ